MAEHSTIEWTDATWNPVTGCSVVSPGCTNCYAMRLAATRLRNHPSRAGLTTMSRAGPVWNGKVRLNEEWVTQPLGWKKPRMIFVVAHGDLFHEAVKDEWIDRIFGVMALCPQHIFQVLTKRSERMRAYCAGAGRRAWKEAARVATGKDYPHSGLPWPLPNVWLGVSCEDQERADERIPDLLRTPAALHFVSLEPLLGPIDLLNIKMGYLIRLNALQGFWVAPESGPNLTGKLGWAIVGGESGPRPMHPDWARSLRDQCAAATVPFFFKQWGSWAPRSVYFAERPDRNRRERSLTFQRVPGASGIAEMYDLGKKHAGRLLDGAEHNGMPEIKP